MFTKTLDILNCMAEEITHECVECNTVFIVDTSRRCWWSQKFCDEDCRKRNQNKIRCQRAKNGTRSSRMIRPKMTAEQAVASRARGYLKSAESRRGQEVSQERRDKISKTLKARYAAGEISAPVFERTPEYREKISQGMVRAYREGRVEATGSYKNKWQVYDGPKGIINMRSKSETIFAYHLDSLGVDWQYEPKRFDLGWSTYTPDFYMPELDRWIEVKGQWTDISLRKFTEFQQTHLTSAVMAKDLIKMGAAGLSPLKRGGDAPW